MSTGYGWEGIRQVCATLLGARHVPERLYGGVCLQRGAITSVRPLPFTFTRKQILAVCVQLDSTNDFSNSLGDRLQQILHTIQYYNLWQESVANAKVSARQPWYIGLPKMRSSANSEKIWTYSSSMSSKVIDPGSNRKRICNFLFVISSNFGRMSYRFWDIHA